MGSKQTNLNSPNKILVISEGKFPSDLLNNLTENNFTTYFSRGPLATTNILKQYSIHTIVWHYTKDHEALNKDLIKIFNQFKLTALIVITDETSFSHDNKLENNYLKIVDLQEEFYEIRLVIENACSYAKTPINENIETIREVDFKKAIHELSTQDNSSNLKINAPWSLVKHEEKSLLLGVNKNLQRTSIWKKLFRLTKP